MKTFDVKLAAQAQRELQKEKSFPDFAPSSGFCAVW